MAPPKVLLIEENVWDIELLNLALTKELGNLDLDVLRSGEAVLAFVREHRQAQPPA